MKHFLKHLWQRELSERLFWFGLGIALIVGTMVGGVIIAVYPRVIVAGITGIAFLLVYSLIRWLQLQWQLYREEYPKKKKRGV